MWLILTHPRIASRSCGDCRRWVYNDDGSQMFRAGKPVPRPVGVLTPCHTCPKIPQGELPVPESAAELTPRLWATWTHYRRCRATGHFPPDPLVADNARVIADVEDSIERGHREKLSIGVSLLTSLLTSGGR